MATSNSKQDSAPFPAHPCRLRRIESPEDQFAAAQLAAAFNPVNRPPYYAFTALGIPAEPQHLALLTSRYWGKSVRLGVRFLDGPSAALRDKILAHMNAWREMPGGAQLGISFEYAPRNGQVRITRTPGEGYWSYLGTDILTIPADQPTMNLDSFTLRTPDSEYRRVVRHETGHTLGFVHEHMRKEIVQRIDRRKAIAYFGRTQGWSAAEVEAQVLTPYEDQALLGTSHAETDSVMCYWLPGSIMKDGQPVIGGRDITPHDYAFAASVYPPGQAETA